MGKKIGLGCLGLGLVAVLAVALFGVSSYNGLVSLDQAVQAQWAQVENAYQRRADLIPNLVETVKGAAAFEKDTFTAVTEARSKVGQVNAAGIANDPAAFAKFQQAQDGLSSALSRLMVVVEKYPDLKATQNFRDLQAQLEGTENRINVSIKDYNTAVQAYNTTIRTFPDAIGAKIFYGAKPMTTYEATAPNADRAPTVKF